MAQISAEERTTFFCSLIQREHLMDRDPKLLLLVTAISISLQWYKSVHKTLSRPLLCIMMTFASCPLHQILQPLLCLGKRFILSIQLFGL